MRRALRLRPFFAAALCAAFFVQSTGAADLAPIFARGMMLPPPGRMAPFPMPGPAKPAKSVKPAGEPWLASAIVVARWVTERLTAPAAVEAAPPPEALASFSAAASNEVAAIASLPSPEPPADRMLISMEGRRVIASGLAAQLASLLQYRSELKPLRPRFVGEWVGKGPVRARVDYLNPFGVTRGEAKGFRVHLSDGYERLLPHRGLMPNSLMRELPLYFAGDSVDVEATVLNTGSTMLTDLSVAAVQEEHTASGDAGAPLTSPVINGVASLAPGATAVLRWRIKLSSGGREAVNFEQTHLRVLGKDPAGSEKVLLDQAQAGIVDPPGPE
ncbi:MAG: hypothetical protein PHS14_10270 [Elusimicrobia bacterium]|nr:hypothetical protein [Elusimicrobiota bacterium]